MERKWAAAEKAKDSWFFDRLLGGPRPDQRHQHHQQPVVVPFLRRRPATLLCISLVITCFTSIAGVRLMTHSARKAEREVIVQEELQEKRDPSEPYRLGPLITDWDEQRAAWLARSPGISTNTHGKPRIFMVSGSANKVCDNAAGDFWLLKAYKNKVDYCRLHDIEVYYNMAVMDPAMQDFWTKLPLVRKMMLAHPEAEWIWWMDSDALITDMTFEIPLERYDGYNMVIHGYESDVFEKKSWVGLNAGVFLFRNCQWTLAFLDLWAFLGEDVGDHRWDMGKVLSGFLTGRMDGFSADDQSALIYLLHKMKDTIYPKVYMERSYYLQGFWVELVEKFEENLAKGEPGFGDDRWPFVTHFVGCKLCGHNNDYPTDKCLKEMNRAFNMADNQVLSELGFRHKSLESPSLIRV